MLSNEYAKQRTTKSTTKSTTKGPSGAESLSRALAVTHPRSAPSVDIVLVSYLFLAM